MTEKEKEEDSEKDSDSQESAKPILSPGNLLAFGSINLIFTLPLQKHDIKKYKIKFDTLKALEDIKFITKHDRFLKRVDITTKTNVMDILLQINKSAKKMLKIGYISYNKMVFKENQEIFKDFIDKVTKLNGINLTSCNICKCQLCIELVITYEKKVKKFVICGQSLEGMIKEENDEDINSGQSDDNNENNNSKKVGPVIKTQKENKYEEKNPFINITKEIVKLTDYDYLYFNYNDYISGEFGSSINIINVYEYFQNIKLTSKSKIILNLENMDLENDSHNLLRDLLALTDIFIFYDKNKLYKLLKSMKEQEDYTNTEKLLKFHSLQAEKRIIEKEEIQQIEEEKTRKYKLFLEKEKEKEKRFKKIYHFDKYSTEQNESYYNFNNYSKSKILLNQDDNDRNKESEISEINKMLNTATDDGISPNKKKSRNNFKKKHFYLKLGQSKALNKNQIWEYFKHGIYNKDPQKKGEKILIAMDDFKKIFFVKFSKKEEYPSVLEYDLKLYPKINLQNMKEILDFKKLLKSNFDDYIKIYIGTILGVILKKNYIEDNDFLLGYLYATNKIKKLAEIKKYNLPLPREKNFFYPNLNKKSIEKMFTKTFYNKKERLFVLDGNKKKTIGIRQYNPLLDKNLASFFSSKNNQNFLKSKGFINKEGEIMYDPIYKDTLKDKKNNNLLIDDSTFYKSFQTTNKFLSGYKNKKQIPEYSIYHPNKSNIILPLINKNKKNHTVEKNNKEIISEAEDESGNNSGSKSNSDANDSGSGAGDSGTDNNNDNDNDKESNKESDN